MPVHFCHLIFQLQVVWLLQSLTCAQSSKSLSSLFLQKFEILPIVSKKGAQVGWQSAGHSNRNRGLNYFCTYIYFNNAPAYQLFLSGSVLVVAWKVREVVLDSFHRPRSARSQMWIIVYHSKQTRSVSGKLDLLLFIHDLGNKADSSQLHSNELLDLRH